MNQFKISALALAAASVSAALFMPPAVAGQEPIINTPFTVDFGGASVSGVGRVIKASSVPLVVNGTTAYFDLNFELQYQPTTGAFSATLVSADSVNTAALNAKPSAVNFIPGDYVDLYSLCTYRVGSPAYGNAGVRFYTASLLSNPQNAAPSSCPTSHNWSTENPLRNNFVIGFVNSDKMDVLRTDVAYGQRASDLGTYQVITTGDTINFGYISNTSGGLNGNGYTLKRK